MKKFFHHLSIRSKLILVIFATSTLVSLLGFTAVMAIDDANIRQDAVTNTQSVLQVFSQDFVKLALLSDVNAAADIVTKLRSFPLIHNVFLYDKQGQVAFTYEKSPSSAMEPPAPVAAQTAVFRQDFLHLTQPLEYAGRNFGSIYVRVSGENIQARRLEYYRIIGLVFLALPVLSYLLALWLQRYFSQSIVRLSEEMQRIADEEDFSRRLHTNENDEIGSLYDSFDRLLQVIEDSQDRLRNSESRLTAIIDLVGSAIISINEQHDIILFNRRAETIFGYTAKEALGKHVNILLPLESRPGHDNKIDLFQTSNVKSIKGINRPEIMGLRKNGEEFPLEASISQLTLNGKRIFIVAMNDISERIRAERELEAYRQHLEELVQGRTNELLEKNRELEAFSYSVAHDLRAPLRSITSFSQILRDEASGKLTTTEQDSLNRVIRAALHMSRLIDDLLTLARIGRSSYQLLQVNLSELVHKTRRQLEKGRGERQVKWYVQDGVIAYGDPQLLEVVIQNLLGNAWKYTSKKPQAAIEFGASMQDGRPVYYVRDDGAGFDMSYVDKLFGVFQRLHRSEDFEGTGIGLATVQRIIQRHGGKVWAEGVVNQGATFYFTLG